MKNKTDAGVEKADLQVAVLPMVKEDALPPSFFEKKQAPLHHQEPQHVLALPGPVGRDIPQYDHRRHFAPERKRLRGDVLVDTKATDGEEDDDEERRHFETTRALARAAAARAAAENAIVRAESNSNNSDVAQKTAVKAFAQSLPNNLSIVEALERLYPLKSSIHVAKWHGDLLRANTGIETLYDLRTLDVEHFQEFCDAIGASILLKNAFCTLRKDS